MASKNQKEAQNPLILRCHRLMDAFAKSDDERDFYIDRLEGFLVYVDLDKSQEELETLEDELRKHQDRFCQIPKLSFYETKKIMEGFVNEKVYDIDTKEKLLDIIQSKEARENFLEFIFDHHAEQEKWHQYYQERSRIRIIEWLRANHFHFVFEEDLDLPRQMSEKLKQSLFQPKVGKDILAARKMLAAKAKTYYSNEALNPRPKRGRPPKQAVKQDIEPQVTVDIYTTVTPAIRPFLFTPEINQSSIFSAFSSKFGTDEDHLQRRIAFGAGEVSLAQKLASLRTLSSRWVDGVDQNVEKTPYEIDSSFDDDDDEDEDGEGDFEDDEGDFEDDEDDDGFVIRPRKKKNNKSKGKSSSATSKEKKVAKLSKAVEKKTVMSKTETSVKPTAKSAAGKKRIMPPKTLSPKDKNKEKEASKNTKGLKKLRSTKKK